MNIEKQLKKENQKQFMVWLKCSNVSFKDAFTILWWSLFNKNKRDILMKGYYDGYTFKFAMSNAKAGKFN